RLPGRHHKRAHWSTVWNGSEFVGGHEAIDIILGVTGDSPLLIPVEMGDYGKAALLDEITAAAAAGEGHRHDTVRASALRLESLAKAGCLTEREAVVGIYAAARGNGLEAEGRMAEVDDLLQSARRKARPRSVNVNVNDNGRCRAGADQEAELPIVLP